jgi:menaquinone-dependent protoporphyrinogen IX oxidase
MADVLCMYYSRTGNTKQTMQEIAEALDAELVELQDGVDRSGWSGWLRSGLDAVRRTTRRTKTFKTEKKLSEYRLVIIGTPVWAGRCSSIARGFLKEYGKELQNAAYVLLRGSEDRNEEIFEQMDLYTPCGHVAAVSLRRGSVGYAFWAEEFMRQVREFLNRK